MTKDMNVSPEENPSVEQSAAKEEAKKISFADLGLKDDILQNLNKLGFEYPTEIQEKLSVLKGSADILGIFKQDW